VLHKSVNVTTRFLEYQNGYNELEIEPIYYENSVLYLDAESGQRVFFEDQNLIRDRDNGSTVVITALQREFSQSGTGRVTLELYPTDGGTSLPDGEVNVTLPTRLSEGYWRGELDDGDADENDTVRNFSYNNRAGTVNQVLFNVTSEELEFNTVGINNEPDGDDSVSDMGARGGPPGGGPAADQVRYVPNTGSAARAGPESRIDLDIENTEEPTVTITDIKIESKQGKLASIRESRGGTGAGQHEIFIASSTPGIYEGSGSLSPGNDPGQNGYILGTKQGLTQNGQLGSFERAQITLLEFRNSGGNIKDADGKELTVTLYFEDGSDLIFSFTPPGY